MSKTDADFKETVRIAAHLVLQARKESPENPRLAMAGSALALHFLVRLLVGSAADRDEVLEELTKLINEPLPPVPTLVAKLNETWTAH